MKSTLERVKEEAIRLARGEKLALAKVLLDSDAAPDGVDVEELWDAEIRERVRAIDEGKTEGIPYEQVLRRVDEKLGQ